MIKNTLVLLGLLLATAASAMKTMPVSKGNREAIKKLAAPVIEEFKGQGKNPRLSITGDNSRQQNITATITIKGKRLPFSPMMERYPVKRAAFKSGPGGLRTVSDFQTVMLRGRSK